MRPLATLIAGGTTKVKILKWYGLSNKLFEGLFCGQSIDYEITIPDHIVNIDGLAFQEKDILFNLEEVNKKIEIRMLEKFVKKNINIKEKESIRGIKK